MKFAIAKSMLWMLLFTLFASGLHQTFFEGPGPAPLPPGSPGGKVLFLS